MNSNCQALLSRIGKVCSFPNEKISHINECDGFGNNALHCAIIWEELDSVKLLVEAGININQQGEFGFTPLHEAVEFEHKEILLYLLESGADQTIKNNEGETPLQMAQSLEYLEIVKAFPTTCS